MLEEYMESLSAVQMLAREEEALLWKRYKEDGDEEARGTLIENYQPLVFREAMKYRVQETVLMDLLQEGAVGLMEAAEGYNHKLGVAFSLYAVHRIRGRMLDFLKTQGTDVSIDGVEDGEAWMVSPDLAFETADRSFCNRRWEARWSVCRKENETSSEAFSCASEPSRRRPEKWTSRRPMSISWKNVASSAFAECSPR